jgi:hypothetical protein
MTATIWQPGDTLPYLEIANEVGFMPQTAWSHDFIEEHDDHDDTCNMWCSAIYAKYWWDFWSQLGPHDDNEPPLAWLHGRTS